MKDTDLVRYSRHIMLPEIDIEGQKKISLFRKINSWPKY